MYPADILAGGELDKSASGGSSVFGTIAENAWESICTVYKHLEIDLGVGQGLYGSLGSLGFIPLEGVSEEITSILRSIKVILDLGKS